MTSHLSGPLKKGPVQPYVQLPDQICNSPYCQPYNSHNVSSENLVLDQFIIPKLILFFILMIYLVDNVLIFLSGEILSWSLMRVKGLKRTVLNLPNLTLWLWLSFPAYTSNTFKLVFIHADTNFHWCASSLICGPEILTECFYYSIWFVTPGK